MSAFEWDEELTDENRDQLIEKLARRVQQYRMSVPAILALEMHKPFTFLASQTIVLGSGFLAPVFGLHNVQQYSKLFESRENVERLICRIEALAASPESSVSSGQSPESKPAAESKSGGALSV